MLQAVSPPWIATRVLEGNFPADAREPTLRGFSDNVMVRATDGLKTSRAPKLSECAQASGLPLC